MDSNKNGSANCLPPNAQVGEYRLLDVIGEGGFGIVYRAQDLSLDRVIAIKEYLPATMASRNASSEVHVRSQHRGAFDAGLRSFINEARLLAKFSHPALVQVYRFFEGNGTAYMVMRCYEGQTLRTYLESQPKNLDERWLKATLCPLFDVLEMLHAADCYHRDIAPDNVFLQNSGMPVLLDFGAARRIISDMTQALTMVLKPGFAPIEQYAEDGSMPQGAWTDIYQLGALLYQVITGKTPTTSVARMINDPIKPLTSAQYPGFSDEFLAGVHKALAVKPLERPQSIAELKTLLGINDFSTSSFSRLPSDFEQPSFSSSGFSALNMAPAPVATPVVTQAVPFAVTVSDVSEPVQSQAIEAVEATAILPETFPSAPATVVHEEAAASPIEQVSLPQTPSVDPMLAMFDAAPNMPTSGLLDPLGPEPMVSAVDTPKAETEKPLPINKKAEAGPPTAAKPQPVAAGAKTSGKKPLLWAGMALVVIVIGLLGYRGLTPSPPAPNPEETQWAAVVADPSAQSLQAYLSAFPAGKYEAQATEKLRSYTTEPAVPPQSKLPSEQGSETAGASAGNSAMPETGRPTSESGGASTVPPTTEVISPTQPPVEPPPVIATLPVTPEAVAPPPQAVPLVRGKVLLRITPWGRVFVDRKGVGLTPPRMVLDLPVGSHRISVTNPAAPPMVWTIQVTKDEPVVLTHHFAEKSTAEAPTGTP